MLHAGIRAIRKYLFNQNTSTIEKIISIVGYIYLSFVLVFLGIILNKAIDSIYQEVAVSYKFSLVLAIFFLFLLILRLFFQKLSLSWVYPLLFLGVKRRDISIAMQVLSIFSFYNVVPFLFFTPFLIEHIFLVEGVGKFMEWIAFLLLTTLFINSLVLFFKILFQRYLKPIITLLVVFFLVIDFTWYNVVKSAFTFLHTFSLAEYLVVLSLLYLLFSFINVLVLKRRLYLDKISDKKTPSSINVLTNKYSASMSMTAFFVELKLILRNTRPRTYVISGLILACLWSVLFYESITNGFDYITYWYCVLIVLPVFINYSQYLFSWESCYISFLLTNLNYEHLIKSKYYLLTTFNLLILLAAIIFGLYDIRFFWNLLPLIIFNQGIGIMLLIYLATYNSKGIDLSKGAFMNYEGTTFNQFLMIFIYLLLFAIAGLPYLVFNSYLPGHLILLFSGTLGMIFSKKAISRLTEHLRARSEKLFIGLSTS